MYADPVGAARSARDKLAAARVWLMKHKPFFGVLARALRLEPSRDVAAVRLHPDDRLRFNPLVVLESRLPALCSRLAHVSLHAALGAFGRRGERDPGRWNAAHDLAIEPLLAAADLSVANTIELGRGPLAAGASAEAHYEQLPEGSEPQALWCDLFDPQTETATVTSSAAPSDSDDGPDAPAEAAPSGPQQPRPDELTVDNRGRQLQWRMRLAAAFEEEIASGGKTFGDMPGWLEEMVRATIEPPTDWSAVLQQALTTLTRTDRCYLRPSRRMAALCQESGDWPDVVSMPGRRVSSAGRLACVVDTSASLRDNTLARFLGAIVSVATAEGIDEVRLLQADAAIASDQTMYAAELLVQEIAIVGRGGTDFAPALTMLAAESRRFAQRFTVVYLTDLDGRFPDEDVVSHLDILWLVPSHTARRPPFGRVIEMVERER